MKRVLVWVVEVIVPAVMGWLSWNAIVQWGYTRGVDLSFICIDVQAVVSVLVFLLIARVILRQSGSMVRMALGALCGNVVVRLSKRFIPHLLLSLIESGVLDPTWFDRTWFDWYMFFSMLLPPVGATIGYNLGPKPQTDDSTA